LQPLCLGHEPKARVATVHNFELKIKSRSLKTKVKEGFYFYFCIFPLFWLFKSLMLISHHCYTLHHFTFASFTYYQKHLQILAKGTS
jgi:hypothetical protein